MRFLPECTGEIWHEHWHRYALVRQLSPHANILDVASGEGYGAAMLAESAARVVGVDISPDAILHARNRYGNHANLEFVTASCDNLPLADASFDLAVSFETIEHIEAQQAFISELARVLRPDGVLILSSPNKRIYSDAHDYHNEFHVRELYRDELEDLLLGTFPHISWFGQKLLFHSAIWPESGASAPAEYLTSMGQQVTATGQPTAEPMYFIAVCSRNPAMLPAMLNRLSLFGDVAESVYQDYVKQTRRVMELDSLLKNREQLIAERDEYLSLRTNQMEERERLIAERDELLAIRTEQLNECTAKLNEFSGKINESMGQVSEHDQYVEALTGQIAGYEHQVATLNNQLAERASFKWWLKLPLQLAKRAFKTGN